MLAAPCPLSLVALAAAVEPTLAATVEETMCHVPVAADPAGHLGCQAPHGEVSPKLVGTVAVAADLACPMVAAAAAAWVGRQVVACPMVAAAEADQAALVD